MTEPAAGAHGPEVPGPTEAVQPEPERRWRPSFGLVGQAAVVVGLISGVVGLLFTLAPGLKRERAPQKTAKLELADVNNRATLREYLSADGRPIGSLSATALQQLGVLTTIRYTSTGLGGKELPLVVSLTSSLTGRVVCKHTYYLKAGGQLPLTFRAWSAFPAHPHVANETYNLYVTLFPPSGELPSLDAAEHDGIPLPPPVPHAPIPLTLC